MIIVVVDFMDTLMRYLIDSRLVYIVCASSKVSWGNDHLLV